MLQRRELVVGKGYVNEASNLLREVNAVIDQWTIRYTNYSLATGKLFKSPYLFGKKHQIIRWADREATSEEMACLQRSENEALFKTAEHAQVDYIGSPHVEESLTTAWKATFKM